MHRPDLSANWPGRDAESLLWLASYPRSGNTFTRILLAHYLASDSAEFDLNKLEEFIPSDTSPALWSCASAPAADVNNWEAVWKARPAVLARYRKTKGPQPLSCLKTHSANVMTFGTSGFDFKPNDRAIYLVRHPLDVLVSLADFEAKDIDFTIDVMTHSGFAVSQTAFGRMEVRGSWTEHVASWISSAPCPLLLLRYEELCTATDIALRSILAFLEIPIVEERLQYAVSASRFDKLRQQEAAGNFSEGSDYTASGRFFREGKTLQWLRNLSPRQANRLADACEKVMESLGYAHPRDVLFDGRNALHPLRLRA